MAEQFENLDSSQEESSSTTQTQECTNCKRSRDISEFIGKRGTPVKRCIRCREKDARQGKRPEVRERKNARAREKKYHNDYRNRKREENEEEFLRHNREKAKEWRDNNHENLRKWRQTNLNYKLKGNKQQAIKKNIPYEITDDFAKELMQKECIYCGKYDAEDSLNGVNRLDVRKGFTPENCVSSCSMCSFMKKCLDPNTFIERACHIASVHQGNFQNIKFDAWPIIQKSVSYNDYKKRANKKEIDFEIDEDTFKTMRRRNCYYCDREYRIGSLNGVDRKDNKKGYTIDNVVTCCGECNQMKAEISDTEFIQKCILVKKQSILRRFNQVPLQKYTIIPSVFKKKKEK